MRNNVVRLIFVVLALVTGLAMEEMLPKILCVGFPVLLASVVFFASQRSITIAVFFAFCAGFAEDAASSLPFFMSASFFLLTAMAVKVSKLPYVVAPVAFPLYQLWLGVWTVDSNGGFFSRVFMSIPVGCVTMAATAWVLDGLYRKVGFDEEA